MASIRIRGNKNQSFNRYNTRARPLRGIEYVPLKTTAKYEDEPVRQLYEQGNSSSDVHSIVDLLNARQLGKPAVRRAGFTTPIIRDLALGNKVSDARKREVKRTMRKYPGRVNKAVVKEVLNRTPSRWPEESTFPRTTSWRELEDVERDFDFYHQPDTSVMKPGTSTNFTGLQNLPNSVEAKPVRETQVGSGVFIRRIKRHRMRGPMKRRHR